MDLSEEIQKLNELTKALELKGIDCHIIGNLEEVITELEGLND